MFTSKVVRCIVVLTGLVCASDAAMVVEKCPTTTEEIRIAAFDSVRSSPTLALNCQLGDDIIGDAAQDSSGFGLSLAADGKTVAIGSPYHFDQTGQVRVFHFDGSGWTQKGKDIYGEAFGEQAGFSLSLSDDGETVAIGSPFDAYDPEATGDIGFVRVFGYNGTEWTQKGQDIDGEAQRDQSGTSVSLSANGNTVAIGAPGFGMPNISSYIGNGQVRIYEFDETNENWLQKGLVIDGDPEFFGIGQFHTFSLSANGNTVAAVGTNSSLTTVQKTGHARIYEFNAANSSWSLKGSDIVVGKADERTINFSLFLSADGNTVAISGWSTEAYGDEYDDGNFSRTGFVRVFGYYGTEWAQKGQDIDGEAQRDQSGTSLSLSADGSVIAIGAPNNDGNGQNAGHARVFGFDGSYWTQKTLDIDGEAAGDVSGWTVSLSADGNSIAVSSELNDNANGKNAGHVRVFKLDYNPVAVYLESLEAKISNANAQHVEQQEDIIALQKTNFESIVSVAALACAGLALFGVVALACRQTFTRTASSSSVRTLDIKEPIIDA